MGYNEAMRNALLAAGALGLLAASGCSTNEAPAEGSATPVAPAAPAISNNPAVPPPAPGAPAAPFAGGDAQAPLTPTPDLDKKVADAEKSGDKKALAAALATRGTFRMTDDKAGARVKYRKALDDYRAALAADPKNADALKNKKQIEDIYTMMGRPIPGAEEEKKK